VDLYFSLRFVDCNLLSAEIVQPKDKDFKLKYLTIDIGVIGLGTSGTFYQSMTEDVKFHKSGSP